MAGNAESPLDLLWKQYSVVFREFDDLTLARWMAQTLGQVEGKIWRLSHPLMGAYRLAAQTADERQVWLKRLATAPAAYREAPCCRAPVLPLLTRDAGSAGLVCLHCNQTLTSFEDLPESIRRVLGPWAAAYESVHAVAHWDEKQQASTPDYQKQFDAASEKAERLLMQAGSELAPTLLEFYPAVVWEDQDECLDVRPEDVLT